MMCQEWPFHPGDVEEHFSVITSIGLASFADDDDYVEFIHQQDMM